MLGLCSLLLCGQVPPPLTDLPYRSDTALSTQEVAVTPQGIHIEVKERTLQEVLHSIQRASGIRFLLPHTMLTVPVTATIEARDWPAAVRQLLRPFKTAEVWDDNGTSLQQIYILEGTAAESPSPLLPGPSPDSTNPPAESGTTASPESQ